MSSKKNIKIHSSSEVKTKHIGENTTVWQFCVIMDGAKIGTSCNIGANVFIENKAVIGNKVTIKNGVQVWNNIVIEDEVFIGPNVTFTNDTYPRSNREDKSSKFYPTTIVKKGASIGGGSVILPGVEIGRNSMIGAGTTIVEDVSEGSVVIGPKGKGINKTS